MKYFAMYFLQQIYIAFSFKLLLLIYKYEYSHLNTTHFSPCTKKYLLFQRTLSISVAKPRRTARRSRATRVVARVSRLVGLIRSLVRFLPL